MSPVLGIDLGTTNSVVCVVSGDSVKALPDAQGNLLIPSVVSFHPQGHVLVGHPARERRLVDARNTIYSVKRLIGRPFRSPELARAQERFAFELCEGPTEGVLVRARGETYTLPEISAFVLREIRSIAETHLGQGVGRAVITVPANFNELQRSATKAAGRVAGLEVLRILNEPTAAALAYGYGKGSRERIAVFDLGGGTFDITILELAGDVFEVVSTAGDTFLGGDDIDLLIAEKMADAFLAHHRFDPRRDPQAFERLRAAAEWAKCQLSTEGEVQLRVEELAYGEAGASLDLTFGMTRAALESLARPLVDRAFEVCEDAMKVAGLRPTQLDNVILVGGSTRIPFVRTMVEEYFGRRPLGSIDPDLVVAHGAALQGLALAAQEVIPSQKALAKVALRRVSLADVKPPPIPAEARPKGPAFQPARAPAPPAPPAGDAWGDLAEATAHGVDLAPSATHAAAAGYEEQARSSSIPPLGELPVVPSTPAVPPPPPRRPQQRPAGGNTLGFGSAGMPVPDFGDLPPAPPPLPPAALPPLRPYAEHQPPPQPPALPPIPPPAQMVAVGVLPGAPTADAPQDRWRAISQPGTSQPPASVAPPARAPLLLDVTPMTLGVETVGGFCEGVIARNAAIPVEQTRVFGTGQDGQTSVSVRIYQGESRKFLENQVLGQLDLAGLREASRGKVQIEVSFVLDADGTLGVRARDKDTGREQAIRISLVGGIGEGEIRQMAERQARLVGN